MSFNAVRAVINLIPSTSLSPTERWVLAVVADAINARTEKAWPTQERLCSITGLARSSLNRCLKRLEADGILVRQWRGGTSTVYRLNPAACVPHGDTLCPTVGHETANCVPHGDTNKDKSLNKERAGKEASGTSPPASPSPEKPMKLPKGLSVAAIATKAKHEYADLTDEAILDIKTVNGKYTAEGLCSVWKRAHGKHVAGFQPTLRLKERGQLVQAYKAVGDMAPYLILMVLKDWPRFTAHAKNTAGAFNVPSAPTIGFFLQYVSAAAALALLKEQQADEPPVTTYAEQLKAIKAVQPIAQPSPAANTAVVSVADLESAFEEATVD